MMQIKPLPFSSVRDFVSVHLKCWEETYYGIFPTDVFVSRKKKLKDRVEHIKMKLQEPGYHYYALYDDFQIVGILIFSTLDDIAVLDALYIRKAYQREGNGKKMLDFMEDFLKKEGFSSYSVYVLKMLPSNKFFVKHYAKFIKEDYISIHGKDYPELEYEVKLGETNE